MRWAELHINQINKVVNAFVQRHDQTGGMAADNQRLLNTEALHPFFPLHVGDAIFSLRSALDCCWMGLRRAIDANADKGTLPRGDTWKELKGTVKNTLVEKSFKGAEEFILDGIRPYKDGNEVIWFGGKIDNWNKHNMVIVQMQNTRVRSILLKGRIGITDCDIVGHLPGGAISANFPLEFHPDHKPDVSTQIILRSRKPADERPLVPFLSALLKETHEAVELFVSTFGKK